MKDEKARNVNKLTKLSGVGLKLSEGKGMCLSVSGCKFCGGSMQRDLFLFNDTALYT